MSSHRGVRIALFLCIATLTIAAAFLVIRFAPDARASSNYNTTIEFTPESGQAGTLVTAVLSLQPAAPATYALATTTTPPEQNGCAAAQPLSGVPPVHLTESNPQASSGQVSFHWPEALGPGLYWLCAKPVDGDHPVVSSPVPFVAGASGAHLNPVQVVPGPGPGNGANTLTVVVLGWQTPDTPEPFLIPQGWSDGAGTPISQWETSAANGTNGTWVFTIQLPPSMANGTYAVVVQAGCDGGQSCAVRERSAYFALGSGGVVPTPTPVSSPAPTVMTGTHPRHDTSSTGTPIVLLFGIGLLLAGSATAFAWRFRSLLRVPRAPSP